MADWDVVNSAPVPKAAPKMDAAQKAQTVLDVFDPPDDGKSVPYITRDPEVRKAKPLTPVATSDWSVTSSEPATAQKMSTPDAPQSSGTTPPATSHTPSTATEWLASTFEPSVKAAANLESGMIAPFLSQKSRDTLQSKGLYTPRESPLHEFSEATYGTITAPIQAIINPAVQKVQDISNKTIGKPVTDKLGDLANTAMDVAGFAVPGIMKKGKVPTSLPIEKGLPAQAAQGIKDLLSPKHENTEWTIRSETGTANRETAKAEAKLKESYDKAASLTPEQTNDFYQYVEGKSKGATLQDPTLQKMADDTRGVMKSVRENIESLPEGDKIGFYEDYFPHQFKNPEQARSFANDYVAKQGSSSSLKARKYPTLADAQEAGLELADNNPVRAASKYATGMNNYIASKHIIDQVKTKGDAKYFTPGKQPEGWVPLIGRFAEQTKAYSKDVPGEEGAQQAIAIHQKLYAPPEVARIYNNFYSKGVTGTALEKPYELGRSLTAANTAAELGLSAYHLGTITGQLMANDLSRVLKNTAVGDWTGAGKALKSVTMGQIPFVKGSSYQIGKKVIGQYKGLEDHGLDMESIAEHFEKGGGKIGQDKLYSAAPHGGMVTGRGGIKQSIRDIKETWNEKGVTPKAKAALDVFQRTTQDISYPLFEKYIPSIKTGAFANLMGDWLRQNPHATDVEIQAARHKYVNLVDDRFGEMNMDDVFWNKSLKQLGSLALRAQGWDIGLVRQAGGGVLDTASILQNAFKGKKIPEKLLDRPTFLFSVLGVMGLTSAAYQYMKTGQAPNEMLDYFAPKTGGVSTRGTPERTVLPTAAHGRELLHIAAPGLSEGGLGTDSPLTGLANEAANKIATFPRNVVGAYNNEDHPGNKLAPTTGPAGWAGSIPGRLGHVAQGFLPFSLTDQGDKLKGSNLNTIERRLLGMRPAGMEISDPDNYKQMRWAQEMKKEIKTTKSENKKAGQRE